MDYRIGLDIGIASVGWCVIENDENENPIRIENLGVRCFDVAEVPKTGASLASVRRESRTGRRRLRRRRHRLDRIVYLYEKYNIISAQRLEEIFSNTIGFNVYEIRNRAINSIISNEELAVALYHIAKHRGFKSTRKSEANDNDAGKLINATIENKNLMQNKGYLTVGQMLYNDERFNINHTINARNKSDSYVNSILRDSLVEEVKIIFDKQSQLGNRISEDFINEYLEIMQSQRPYDIGPGKMPNGEISPFGGNLIEKMQGKCIFEQDEKRAFKATYSFQLFSLLQSINNIKVFEAKTQVSRKLTDKERKLIKDVSHKKAEVSYLDLRSILCLDEEDYFSSLNYGSKSKQDVEKKTKFNYLKAYHEIRKKCNLVDKTYFPSLNNNMLNDIGTILSKYKNDLDRERELKQIDVPDSIISQLLFLNFSKTGNLSVKAINKILPFLQEGQTYNEACENAGYNFREGYSKEKNVYLDPNEILCDVPNPVVRRAVSQTIKVVNSIIRQYGSPQLICIELAREMAKNHDERNQIKKSQEENAAKNDRIINEIKELGFKPTGFDVVKFKLWREQNEICMYSGKHISINELFDKNMVDIDHIIPYSKCFDDSYNNKVLVFSEENRLKGNRLPYEYIKENEEKLHSFEVRANLVKNYKKREKLLKKSISEEEADGFIERNLQDTKYISRLLFNYIRTGLQFKKSRTFSKKPVRCNNGAVTNYLRKRWGIDKDRNESDIHHCKDAAVIACTTQKMINQISHYVKGREIKYSHDFPFVDDASGEIIETREQYDEYYGVKIPEPWKGFGKELFVRTSQDPMKYQTLFNDFGYPATKEIKPVFVSRMPKHSVSGAGHDSTIRGINKTDENMVITKTELCNIKWDKIKGEIVGYYNKDDDRLLYDALCKRLAENNYDAKEAFKSDNPFRKPKSDGTPGPIVRKVKIESKQTLGVKINNNTGIAANGDMLRIDVFKEKGKYYFVPIYAADTKKSTLPTKAAVSNKPYSKWKEMKEENFIFSLFSRDLIKIFNDKPIMSDTTNGTEVDISNSFLYYISADINSCRWWIIAHDNSICYKDKKGSRISIMNINNIQKYQVDILGNVYEVKKEKRQMFDTMKR